MLIYGIFAMSLDVLHGYTGMPSLGHAAYFGLAAYVTAICTLKLGWGFAAAGSAGSCRERDRRRALPSPRTAHVAFLST